MSYFPSVWNSDVPCQEKVDLQKRIDIEYAQGIVINGTTDIDKTFHNQENEIYYWTVSDCFLREGQYLKVCCEKKIFTNRI